MLFRSPTCTPSTNCAKPCSTCMAPWRRAAWRSLDPLLLLSGIRALLDNQPTRSAELGDSHRINTASTGRLPVSVNSVSRRACFPLSTSSTALHLSPQISTATYTSQVSSLRHSSVISTDPSSPRTRPPFRLPRLSLTFLDPALLSLRLPVSSPCLSAYSSLATSS